MLGQVIDIVAYVEHDYKRDECHHHCHKAEVGNIFERPLIAYRQQNDVYYQHIYLLVSATNVHCLANQSLGLSAEVQLVAEQELKV